MIYGYVLCCCSLFAFCLFGVDKYKAKHHQYRIQERTLLMACLFFGGIGGVLGMHFFHHKTMKLKFYLVYVFAIIQLIGLRIML